MTLLEVILVCLLLAIGGGLILPKAFFFKEKTLLHAKEQIERQFRLARTLSILHDETIALDLVGEKGGVALFVRGKRGIFLSGVEVESCRFLFFPSGEWLYEKTLLLKKGNEALEWDLANFFFRRGVDDLPPLSDPLSEAEPPRLPGSATEAIPPGTP